MDIYSFHSIGKTDEELEAEAAMDLLEIFTDTGGRMTLFIRIFDAMIRHGFMNSWSNEQKKKARGELEKFMSEVNEASRFVNGNERFRELLNMDFDDGGEE